MFNSIPRILCDEHSQNSYHRFPPFRLLSQPNKRFKVLDDKRQDVAENNYVEQLPLHPCEGFGDSSDPYTFEDGDIKYSFTTTSKKCKMGAERDPSRKHKVHICLLIQFQSQLDRKEHGLI